MGLLLRRAGFGGCCGWLGAAALVGLCCGSLSLAGQVRASPWDAAVAARQTFEAEVAGTHTKAEYAEVMDGFRAIYHANPGDAHAARAVMQVAELLAEQGRELGDAKSLRAAAGQYEFLAKAYPGGTMAPEALVQAVALLGPDAANDAFEKRKVEGMLAEEYPRCAARAAAAGDGDVAGGLVKSGVGGIPANAGISPLRPQKAANSGRDDSDFSGGATAGLSDTAAKNAASGRDDSAGTVRNASGRDDIGEAATGVKLGAPAVVTGIRHWSTASYTRVAIDLNVDPDAVVKYQAARVENPDRIFFDVQHARLAPQLAGKSFTVTDDGFLTRVRAAQFSDDVTRVVLDVHQVAEYSAFLLPNPYRLIIDIHGKAKEQGLGIRDQGLVGEGSGTNGQSAVDGTAVTSSAVVPQSSVAETPVTRPGAGGGAAEVSSLPPMPVTDGSSGFGLPVKGSGTGGAARMVARPRVVISSKPTVARPVPNTVTKSLTDNGIEVAAVSEQPGKVEASRRPTSQPVTSGSRDAHAGDERYVPRSKRTVPATPDEAEVAAPTSQKRDVGHPGSSASAVVAAPVEAAAPTADGDRSLMRALGLKIGRIVIDAGHGGHDSGTLGAGGIEEKDVVLDVALRLGKLLHDRLGAEIVYTRADDTFIPLETRTAIANKAQADLFISVHANSSSDESARGVEVYYLNFTSDPEAMEVASRENAVSTQSVHELSDLVKKIALKDKIEESKELATDVDASLYGGLRRGNDGLKDRGVKKAPFVVLIGANMPSILAEISFVTNPTDAEKLETPEYRERVAESLYKGVARYARGINGLKPRARTTEQAER